MKLSVYIPCYNAAAYLEQSLAGLLNQTRPPDEILVIDDGSSDNTAEVASRFPVRVVRHAQNKGLAAARNTAFANASYDLVGAIDADVVPSPDWLEHLLKHFDDPSVAGTGGRLIEAFKATHADLWRATEMSQDLGIEKIDIEWPSHRCLGGFGTILRKSAVQALGGYDVQYRTNYEDVDLNRRLVQARHKLIFEPRAVAYHQRRDSLRSVVRTSWRWDFWTHYFNGGYNQIWLKVLLNFRWTRVLVWNHVKNRVPSLLLVDLRLPWVHSYLDLRYHFSRERLPMVSADPKNSAVYIPWPFRNLRKNRPALW